MSLPSPSPRAPRRALTLQKKFEVIKLAEEDPKLGLRKLADLFDCGKTQISGILKDKDTVLELYNGNLLSKDSFFLKRYRACEFLEVNEALYRWYESNSVMGVHLPGALLCQKAKEIAECLDMPNFKASNGWLYRWKKRYINQFKANSELAAEDITRKEKGGHGGDEDGGEDDDDTRQYMVGAPDHGGPTAYQRLSDEFDMLDRTVQPAHVVPAQPAPVLISPRIPQAMPVSIPVPSSSSPRVAQRVLVSAGSTGSSSSGTPFSPDTTSSPASTGSGSMMPPPTGTPTRLQTIRNQTLKLHLPGSGRHYISLGSGGSEKKSPVASDDSGGRTGDSNGDGAASSSRPQLRVVLPGQKGFVYRSAPSSPPPMVGLDNTVAAVSSSATVPTVTRANTSAALLNPVTCSMESLTTPVVSLSTPNILSNLSPLLSSLTSELPLGSATAGDSAASALVAFPVSIQPTPGTSRGQASGSNIVLQAQNMGQPFLLAPSNYENKQQLPGTFPFTPSSNPGMGLSPPLIRDLEQLKHQYDRIYQQISQTLHHHQLHQQHSQKDKSDEEDPPNPATTAAGEEGDTATASDPPDGEQDSVAKRPRLDSAATTT